MTEVIVVAEGLTEETFVRDVLAPELWHRELYLEPRPMGGALSRDRVLRFLRNTLRERDDTYVTTLFDLYGLRPDFPGVAASAARTDPIARCTVLEGEFAEEVVA